MIKIFFLLACLQAQSEEDLYRYLEKVEFDKEVSSCLELKPVRFRNFPIKGISESDSAFLIRSVKERKNPKYSYKIETPLFKPIYYGNKYLTTCIIEVQFDSSEIMISQSDMDLLEKLSSVCSLPIINMNLAKKSARPYLDGFRINRNETHLKYDLESDMFYWEICANNRRSDILERPVLIDAITGNHYMTIDEQ